MDFFARQEAAHKKTALLIFYFVLAVAGIIATLQILFATLLGLPWNHLELFLWVAGGTLAVVAAGSLAKTAELAQGGRVVAAMLGGEPISPHTTQPDERRLMNVVEEMSIASGVPVPEVFVIPDRAINAFAAGHGPGDAAIGVTRGAMERLTRDELQGVVAHEFSHLLHGDMRLNLRLMGLLHGILCIALAGMILLRVTFYMPRGSGGDRRGGAGAVILLLLAAGLGLYIVGSIGVFFGNLIKAAVSRQREFLADASAVQYTRNPYGIAGALWKIGQFTSRLSHPRASEASHMYFGDGVRAGLLRLFATHPPLSERIAAIAPDFQPAKTRPRATPASPPRTLPSGIPAASLATATEPLQSALGAAWMAVLPTFALHAAHETASAAALVCALLLDAREDIRRRQLDALAEPLRSAAEHMATRLRVLEGIPRLVLVDLAIPALRTMSESQYRAFRESVERLVAADEQIDVFEFVLQKVLFRHLDLFFTRQTGPPVRYRSLLPLLPDVAALMTAICLVSQASPEARRAAFEAGTRELLVKPGSYPLELSDTVQLDAVASALDRLAEASPDVKRRVLAACSQCAAHDGVVEPAEYELLRAVADALDCPVPPPPPPAVIA